MPPTSPANLPAAARLASATGPLGGATRAPAKASPTSASRTAATAPFSDVLSQQMGAGIDSSDPMSALMGMTRMSSAAAAGAKGASGTSLASAMASPQMAKALSQASKTAAAGATGPKTVPAPTTKAQRAVTWAKSMVGRQDWNNLCERFVEEAYGTRGIYPTAKAAGEAIVTNRGWSGLKSAPPGALLYFAADETNDHAGHAAIYLGEGKMISARPDGVKIEAVDTPYNKARYVGWGEAPSRFPGVESKASTPKASVPALPGALAGGAASATSGATTTAPRPVPANGAAAPPRLPAAAVRR